MEKSITELKQELEKATDDQHKISIKSQISALADGAESKIRKAGRDLQFATREWSIELIVQKYSDGLESESNELFIPDYQRGYKWPSKIYSRFIESILLDFPIPYIYIADVDDPTDPERDGRIEIIDGSQRVRALHFFISNQLPLEDLKEINELEGFYFQDLPASRRRRFLRETIRLIELKGAVDEDTRRDLFERINSGVKRLEAMEVRHGSPEANSKFYKELIVKAAELPLFQELAPLSAKKLASADHREFALRFFAYANDIKNYSGSVKPFLDKYMEKAAKDLTSDDDIKDALNEFEATLSFIQKHIPLGFKRTATSKTTTRARYEALAIGTCFALREDHNLEPAEPISNWITSDEFQMVVGADSANNTSQLLRRIHFVKNKLLGHNV